MPRCLLLIALLLTAFVAPAQEDWRIYPSYEGRRYSATDPPADFERGAEFVVGRLMFPQVRSGNVLGAGGGDWQRGGTAWAVDYPEGDRTFAELLGRLARINVRAVEQPVNLEDGDDVFFWPFMISGLVGAWDLSDGQAGKLRDYLLRGGFLLCDSFFGTSEWRVFEASMQRVFPDRPIVELPVDHPIFHIVYDLTERPQIPNWQHLRQGAGGYRNGGSEPQWRAILDDDDRVMVMIAFNNDIADGWQRADEPDYPQMESTLAIQLGVNFAVYAMTH